MTQNVGTLDRVLRALLGVALVVLAFASGLPFFEGAAARYGVAAIGLVMLAVALFRWCPVYALLGIRTCRA